MGVSRTPRLALSAVCLSLLAACLAAPPEARWESREALVRAEDPRDARAIGELVDRLRPELIALIPGARVERVEVWLQDEPHLYRFPHASGGDAEGLYAPSQNRILLASGLEDPERVLAHELVHATLDDTWAALPGTLEEGLCDAIAARVSETGVARLRAGRLSSAALVCGGLQLEIEIRSRAGALRRGYAARVALSCDEQVEKPETEIFRIAAGLSSTRIEANVKRGFYGLSFLLVDRALDRVGLAGLHELCLRAELEGRDRIPRPWLLEAADLEGGRDAWRLAAARSLGEPELIELARLYPGIVADAVAHRAQELGLRGNPDEWLDEVEIEVASVEGDARARVEGLAEVRAELSRRWN